MLHRAETPDRHYFMQQQNVLNYGHQPRRRSLSMMAFHIVCAIALTICIAAMVAQAAGWGRPLMQSLDSSMRPVETRYGLRWGHHYATFATLIRITIWFPIAWLSLFVGRILYPRLRRGHAAAI